MKARTLRGAVSDYLRRNALACVALFFTLSGGVAWATHPGGANTIGSTDIINEEVRTADLAPLSVTGGKLATGSVGSGKVVDESLRGDDIALDSIGAPDIGPDAVGSSEIAALAVGADEIDASGVGSDELATITQVQVNIPFGDQDEGNNDYEYGTNTASCPAGTQVIGGGANWNGAGQGGAGGDELQAITESVQNGNGWTVTGVSDVDDQDLTAYAFCLPPGLPSGL
jgi:hypothetical protein